MKTEYWKTKQSIIATDRRMLNEQYLDICNLLLLVKDNTKSSTVDKEKNSMVNVLKF